MKKLLFACSTRKDLIKISPLVESINKNEAVLNVEICYCGIQMDIDSFINYGLSNFLAKPDYQFSITQNTSDNAVIELANSFDKLLSNIKPDILIIPSTYFLAFGYCQAAYELNVPICLLDAGMKESDDNENNANLSNALISEYASLLFVTSENALANIKSLNLKSNKDITKIENLIFVSLGKINEKLSSHPDFITVSKTPFLVAYLFNKLAECYGEFANGKIKLLMKVADNIKIKLYIHTYALELLKMQGIEIDHKNIQLISNLGYLDFLLDMKQTDFFIADNENAVNEAIFYGKNCLLLKNSISNKYDNNIGIINLLGTDPIIAYEKISYQINSSNSLLEESYHSDITTLNKIVTEIKKFLG